MVLRRWRVLLGLLLLLVRHNGVVVLWKKLILGVLERKGSEKRVIFRWCRRVGHDDGVL